MVVNGRPMKRVKRRVTADLSDFFTFPIGGEVAPGGPFRTRVKEFLQKNALLPPPSSLFPHLLTWQVLFRVGNIVDDDGAPSVVCLDVVEEDVASSRSVYCDQCRVVGWSSNPVSAKRYHFIIKADGNSIGGYNKTCAGCGDALHMADSRCKTCNHVMTTEDVEDWMYHQLEDTTHLLHGVVHANGYGHLLRVNGREGGSKVLSGRHIMSFWDRLCTTLGVRKISVMDVSKKHGLELRLLHAITRGHPCFQSQGRKPRTILQDLISFYQSLSERELVNTRDLFCFLMSLIHDVQNSPLKVDDPPCKKSRSGDSRVLCAWTIKDIARIEEAMIKVLRAVTGSTWVRWRALRGAVCKLGPPELLDYCLRELKGKQTAEGMFVNARCASDSGATEYRLEPRSVPMYINSTSNSPSMRNYPSKEHLLRDLKYLYAGMLHPESMKSHFPPPKRDLAVNSATAILDCKQFVKDYNPEKLLLCSRPNVIQLLCEVDLTEQFEEHSPNPPPEILTLPLDATIADLKMEAMKAFQEVYVMFRRFQAEELIGYGGVDESTQVKLLLGSTEFVRIRGRFLGKNSLCRFKTERGLERWTVDCCCGAKDDDGERMLACDVCGVWQHTRCCGIPDSEAVPTKFFCNRCRGGLKISGHLKDEMVDSVCKSLTNQI
ncbi:unnamed protein product [Fraxinus pennsylvanica]|uniref:Zinc finger PHD-type domain-containing protein n=1 Tax=Fraxinus pennsylvanica TaxID=56036 RepID=A0AAD1ZXJ7_9LAMI|nr:unnamed protein product [Fraxinus pennsylvanica]